MQKIYRKEEKQCIYATCPKIKFNQFLAFHSKSYDTSPRNTA